ncbi:MAG: hypothetical protein ABJQ71_01085 [Roseibium sp.]
MAISSIIPPPAVNATEVNNGSGSSKNAAAGETLADGFGWDPSGINRTIEVNGEVIGVLFNSGTISLDEEFADFGQGLFGSLEEAELFGPNLADHRTSKLLAALEDLGGGNKVGFSNEFSALLKIGNIKAVMASTAVTQAEFMDSMGKPSPSHGQTVDRLV